MRLFVAIDWTEKNEDLLALQEPFTKVKARLVKDFHLTLKFLGEVSPLDCKWIDTQLRSIVHESFSLKPDHLGNFKTYSQQVIWCGVNESGALGELEKKVEVSLKERFSESASFRPHITLARIKHPYKLSVNEKALLDQELKREVECSILYVRHFLLIKSQLTTDGPVYTVLKSYPLL
jgi:2'-5' RNA ligase